MNKKPNHTEQLYISPVIYVTNYDFESLYHFPTGSSLFHIVNFILFRRISHYKLILYNLFCSVF